VRRNFEIELKAVRIRAAIFGLVLAVCGVLAVAQARAQIGTTVGDGGPGPVKAQHMTAELVSLGPAVAPGGTQEVGLLLTIEESWHVYWINAGDSGEPPHIAWTLPPGITAGPMQFPIPERLPLGPLMDFGYDDIVAFPVTVSAAPNLKSGPVHLDAKVDWLVCSSVCIPGKAHLGIDLTVQPGAPRIDQEPRVGALGEAMNLIPGPLPPGGKFTVEGDAQGFTLTLTDGKSQTNAEFYPFPADKGPDGAEPTDLIANAAKQMVDPLSDGVRLRVQRSPDLAALPTTLHGVMRLSDAVAYDVTAPVVPGTAPAPMPGISNSGAGSAASSNAGVSTAAAGSVGQAASASGVTALGAIGLAFVGGIILNLMPCVFPVLFLKGLALVQSSGQERGHLRRHGLVYTLGILVSFWAIVAVLLIVRAGGSHAGWGFQLQSPVFLTFLASAIFFFALSLAGLFDIGLSLTSVGGELAQKQGYAGSFFTGVLATVVATPCTAPLMGAAIGFALAQPVGITFAVFTALALGLAAPYLLLSFQPAWTRILPRPGAWMEIFKQLTAAIFFATVIWLAWVYGQLFGAESGVDQLAWLLACFLMLAVAGWVLGKWPARWPSTIAAVALIALGLSIPLSQEKAARAATISAATSASASGVPGATANSNDADLVWTPYSETALDAAHASGRPVFIDFTAAWCLSCKFNERAVLKSGDVESALRTHNVTLLKADWTNEDPEITKKLASVNRAGVPTYVIYPAAASAVADVLPELLTKDLVLKAIERDTK
jgi:thiol:disulfide interchange protein/DsbC/DsbD-like thiol-disulfide interchange protein